jgi:hypothetical protein
MDFRYWLDKQHMSANELARRLGHANNGAVSSVATGKRDVPLQDAPQWADALRLVEPERRQFLDQCRAASLPSWILDEHRALTEDLCLCQAALVEYRATVKRCHTMTNNIALEMERLCCRLEQAGSLPNRRATLPEDHDAAAALLDQRNTGRHPAPR